jgi:ParB-like partition proteins
MSSDQTVTLAFKKNEIKEISLSGIEPDQSQIRKEFREQELEALALSIQESGQHQPIHVTEGKKGKYKIIDGERRWRAHRIIADKQGKSYDEITIRAIYVTSDDLSHGILENLLHESYNDIETSDALSALQDLIGKKATVNDIALKIGKSRSLVAERLSLRSLPEAIKTKARVNSCVPFRELKRLAASKQSDEDKIKHYEELYLRYMSKKNEKQLNKKTEKVHTSRETRTVASLTKKIESLYVSLEKMKFNNVDNEVKQQFIATLKQTLEAAELILKSDQDTIK